MYIGRGRRLAKSMLFRDMDFAISQMTDDFEIAARRTEFSALTFTEQDVLHS